MKNRIICIILGVLLGIVIGILIMHTPKIRYDFNNNGKIDVGDIVKFQNYYYNH